MQTSYDVSKISCYPERDLQTVGTPPISVRLTERPGVGWRGGGYFPVKDYWGCAAGWGRIFTTGYIFSRVTRMGSHIFGISGIRKLW